MPEKNSKKEEKKEQKPKKRTTYELFSFTELEAILDRPSMLTRAKTAQLEGERSRPPLGTSSLMRSQLNNIPEESRKSEEEKSSSQGKRSSAGGRRALPRKDEVHTDTPFPFMLSHEDSVH